MRINKYIISISVIIFLFITVFAYTQTAGDYFNSGVAKADLEDYKGAIADYSKAIELNPKLAEAYAARGLAKIGLGQNDNGCLDLSKAGEMGYAEAYDLIKKYCN